MFIVLHRHMGVTFLMHYFQQLLFVLNYVALSGKSCLKHILGFLKKCSVPNKNYLRILINVGLELSKSIN